MGCHVYIQNIKTGKETFRTFLRVPPAFYDTELTTKAEVEAFVSSLRKGTFPCNADKFGGEENCCTYPCRTAYKYKKKDVNWILEDFREGRDKIILS